MPNLPLPTDTLPRSTPLYSGWILAYHFCRAANDRRNSSSALSKRVREALTESRFGIDTAAHILALDTYLLDDGIPLDRYSLTRIAALLELTLAELLGDHDIPGED